MCLTLIYIYLNGKYILRLGRPFNGYTAILDKNKKYYNIGKYIADVLLN